MSAIAFKNTDLKWNHKMKNLWEEKNPYQMVTIICLCMTNGLNKLAKLSTTMSWTETICNWLKFINKSQTFTQNISNKIWWLIIIAKLVPFISIFLMLVWLKIKIKKPFDIWREELTVIGRDIGVRLILI